jgi:2-keto-4-pentenoate hydratase/2-oxohepta-3-ene-1,7-dioic acid hydratase in catechol pathway
MKIVRCVVGGETLLGEWRNGKTWLLEGSLLGGVTPTGVEIHSERILAPLDPVMVIGIGLNYRHHAEETRAKIPEHPVVFFKALGAVCGPGDPIQLPRRLPSTKVDFEAELAVVIGRECRNVAREEALDYVLGCTCANDVSARDWQKEWGGSQWSRAKSFDTFCPLGPAIVTLDELGDPNRLSIKGRLNGEIVQDWTTKDMIFSVPELIEFLSGDTTLPAGTVILTGTPHGVGMARTPPLFLQDGDRFEVEIEKIGALSNPVVA